MYDNPFDFIHDVCRNKIPLRFVTLEDWIQGCTVAMISKHQPKLEMDIEYGGGIYTFSHIIKIIRPPMTDVGGVMETKQ